MRVLSFKTPSTAADWAPISNLALCRSNVLFLKVSVIFGLEPTSSAAPRVSEGRLHEKTIKVKSEGVLLCLCQGYPLPSFRYCFIDVVEALFDKLLQ